MRLAVFNGEVVRGSFHYIMNIFPCKFVSIIGQGAFGVVYKAVTADQQVVAVKEVVVDSENKELIEREVEILTQLNHPNIVRYYGSMCKDNKYYIALEYCQGGDLEEYLKCVQVVNKKIVLYWFKQLVSALSYLQSNFKMHRDIKPANLYLNSLDVRNADIKLGDFGFSRVLANNIAQSKLGTPLYMAPELFSNCSYDYRADVWSLGCLIYELIEGVPMYNASSVKELITMQRSPPKFSEKFSQAEAEFLSYLVRYQTEYRPNFLQLENSYFIRGIQKPLFLSDSDVGQIVKVVNNAPILAEINKKLKDLASILKIFSDILENHQDWTYFFIVYLKSRCSGLGEKLRSLKPENFENEEKKVEFEGMEKNYGFIGNWVDKRENGMPVSLENFNVSSGQVAEFINTMVSIIFEYNDSTIQFLLADTCLHFDRTNEVISQTHKELLRSVQ